MCLALSLAAPAAGQAPLPEAPPAEAKPAEPTAEQIEARLAESEDRLATLKRRAEGARSQEAEILAQRIERLERVDRLLALQVRELQRAAEIEAETAAEADATVGPEARFEHPPPYSVAELDSVLDELEAAAGARELSEESHGVSRRQMERAKERVAEREREERLARDQLDENAPEPEELRLLVLDVEAAREQLHLRRLEMRRVGRELEVQQAREAQLEALARQVRDELAPTADALESTLADLTERIGGLDEALASARERAEAAEERFSAAQDRVEMAADPSAELVAQAAARQLELAAAQTEEELLQKQRLRAGRLAELWRLRFQTFGLEVSPPSAARPDELGGALEGLGRERHLAEARLDERRLALNVVYQRLAGDGPGAGERRWLERQRQQLDATVALFEGELADIDRSIRLTRRVQADVGEQLAGMDLGERLGLLRDRVKGAWNFEITKAEDNPITVGKVVIALLLILVGTFVSKWLSRRLGRSVLPRFGLAAGAAVAFQTLVYYGLFAIFFLWALRLVNIPLTVFTVLGGVLAIGLGFGSQNIINNFISGLIILAEQPVKVGDLIDVDGVFGKVERIGPRSSRIRAGDNTHVIVPNSAFLEKNVLNWTVSDDVIRTRLDVGVAYGTPAEEAAETLRQAIAGEPEILAEPAPEVLFTDFGDDALIFRALFWVRIGSALDRTRIQSRLRFRLDRLFREAGIEIAFPQRDVHLDSRSPLEVRVVDGAPER